MNIGHFLVRPCGRHHSCKAGGLGVTRLPTQVAASCENGPNREIRNLQWSVPLPQGEMDSVQAGNDQSAVRRRNF